MLALSLDTKDIGLPWRRTIDGFSRGASYIEPFRHSALEEVVVASAGRLLVCVRERCADAHVLTSRASDHQIIPQLDSGRFDDLVQQLRTWPLQWQLLLIEDPPTFNPTDTERVLATVEAGHWGTAPIFFVTSVGVLRGDWDASRLLKLLPPNSLDPVRATRYLAEYANPYASNTLFRGLHLLTERSRAVWRGKPGLEMLTLTYPAAWHRPHAGTLRQGGDPILGFDTILSASLQRWCTIAEEQLGVEVSGGLDSAIVASTTAALCEGSIRSYGVALMGDSAEHQRLRRAELAQHFHLTDIEIPIESFLPLAPGSCRLTGDAPVLPWEEGYYEVFHHLLARASAADTKILFTGFGGDELCGLRPSEIRALRGNSANPTPPTVQPEIILRFLTADARATLSDPLDLPPRAAASESSVECAAFSAARYLRHGIWPVHPLCTPELVQFCARLPLEWRHRRKVERDLLACRGCSSNVIRPPHSDDFSFALAAALRGPSRPLLNRLFSESFLHQFGIVDAGQLRRDYDAWCEKGHRDEAVQFFAAALMELCLRSMA